MAKCCFVISPIGAADSEIRLAADDFMKYIVLPCEALKEFEYAQPIRADQLGEPGRVTSQIIKLLIESDLVIADLTGNNENVYYELSLRHAIGKPVIHMAFQGTKLPFDVYDNRTIFYTMHSRIAENAKDELAKQIRQVNREGYKATNPIVETVGLINLDRSSDPTEKTLGRLIRMVEGLTGDVEAVRRDLLLQQETSRRLAMASSGLWPLTTVPGGLWALHQPVFGETVDSSLLGRLTVSDTPSAGNATPMADNASPETPGTSE